MFERLQLKILGVHLQGLNLFMALIIAFVILLTLKKFFAGAQCNIYRDLTGEVAILTGGNTGIGKETVRKLVQCGCFVIFGSRDMQKNQEAKRDIKETAQGKGRVEYFQLDLADKNSILNFSMNVKKLLGSRPINHLINNAGVYGLSKRVLTKDGFEMTMGVNHFGHFYLTALLRGKIKQSGNPRILNVSSEGHKQIFKGDCLDFDDINYDKGYSLLNAYARSKKANVLFTKELQRKMDQTDIGGTAICLHPGIVRTEIQRNLVNSPFRRFLFKYFATPFLILTFKSFKEGAQTTIYGVLEREDKLVKAAYYSDCKVEKLGSKQCESEEAAKRLWQISEQKLGIKFDV